mmetsp:Transcript_44772/g.129417  ORF Transcript_44772/g.129417 Transcript_44772/m.129417 type:complete len:274 (+) Transcript_44772:1-822(+)
MPSDKRCTFKQDSTKSWRAVSACSSILRFVRAESTKHIHRYLARKSRPPFRRWHVLPRWQDVKLLLVDVKLFRAASFGSSGQALAHPSLIQSLANPRDGGIQHRRRRAFRVERDCDLFKQMANDKRHVARTPRPAARRVSESGDVECVHRCARGHTKIDVGDHRQHQQTAVGDLENIGDKVRLLQTTGCAENEHLVDDLRNFDARRQDLRYLASIVDRVRDQQSLKDMRRCARFQVAGVGDDHRFRCLARQCATTHNARLVALRDHADQVIGA